MRILTLGVSDSEICGVRDYATLLGGELERRGHVVTTEWLDRPTSPLQTLRWARAAPWSERHGPVDVVLWHYSVFAYATRGVPTVSWPLAFGHGLRRSRIPVVTVLHEFAFPWGRDGFRGAVWAATQRFALPPVVASSRALVVTVADRADWLGRRGWVPSRPTIVAPVFSNLPEVAGLEAGGSEAAPVRVQPMRIGMFGYPASAARIVTRAVGRLHAEGVPAELRLIGGPGPASSAGSAWRAAAGEEGIESSLQFTGIASPEALAGELRSCSVLVFDDGTGPSSRKGTLAAMLASGTPVVAVDGSETWDDLARDGAICLVASDADVLCGALRRLLGEARVGGELGSRGRRFYEARQALELSGDAIDELIRTYAT